GAGHVRALDEVPKEPIDVGEGRRDLLDALRIGELRPRRRGRVHGGGEHESDCPSARGAHMLAFPPSRDAHPNVRPRMKTVALVVFIVAIAEPLLMAQAARTITITGRVLADDNGEPIANARVAAISTAPSAPVTLTDDEGRFTLTAADASRIAA